MIPAGVRVFVCTEPVDMRLGFDRLAYTAKTKVGEDPQQGGALFVFGNRGATRLKVLWFDRNGYCLLYKRLHRAVFELPLGEALGTCTVRIDGSALAKLLGGVVARALLDSAERSPRLYPVLTLAKGDAQHLGAAILFTLILLGLVPGRVHLGRRGVRRGYVLIVLAVFGASLTPLPGMRPAAAAGGGAATLGDPPPPSYPVYFLHHDHLGSTVMATCYKRPAAENCADGAVARYFRYDGYGALKAFRGDGVAIAIGNQLLVDRLYTGQRWEWQTRMYDYNARFYEPRIGRFLSRDPVRQFANPYSYVGWKPTALIRRARPSLTSATSPTTSSAVHSW